MFPQKQDLKHDPNVCKLAEWHYRQCDNLAGLAREIIRLMENKEKGVE